MEKKEGRVKVLFALVVTAAALLMLANASKQVLIKSSPDISGASWGAAIGLFVYALVVVFVALAVAAEEGDKS